MSTSPIDRIIERCLKPIPETVNHSGGELYATRKGVLKIGDFPMRCYQLNDGQRVFDADDVARFLGDELTGCADDLNPDLKNITREQVTKHFGND